MKNEDTPTKLVAPLLTPHQEPDLWTDEVTLDGRRLRLEPLVPRHLEDLARNLLTPDTWFGAHSNICTREALHQMFLVRSVEARSHRTGTGFAMVLRETGEAVGISHYMQLNRPHRSLEIGGTWIGKKWQRSFVNSEAKLLMLGYAFETIGCQRVEFRVDALNFRSQAAVLRIGAKYEGELRQTRLLHDGRKRDYKVYSVIDHEWPNLKKNLTWYLDRSERRE